MFTKILYPHKVCEIAFQTPNLTPRFVMSLLFSALVLFLPLVKSFTIGESRIQTPLVEESEETFLKLVFPGGEEEYVRNWECHEGIWAEEMYKHRQPNCVCVKGV